MLLLEATICIMIFTIANGALPMGESFASIQSTETEGSTKSTYSSLASQSSTSLTSLLHKIKTRRQFNHLKTFAKAPLANENVDWSLPVIAEAYKRSAADYPPSSVAGYWYDGTKLSSAEMRAFCIYKETGLKPSIEQIKCRDRMSVDHFSGDNT